MTRGICKSKKHNRNSCPLKAPQTEVPQLRASQHKSRGSNVQSIVNRPNVAKQVNVGVGRGTSSIPARGRGQHRRGSQVTMGKGTPRTNIRNLGSIREKLGRATSKFIPNHRSESQVKNAVEMSRDLGFKAK
ncbi:hypothetical protein GH714_014099 [Hevea brasiliensis]|uniref:Uncharacterized protein n=1 Tax=Hevea brasiliensis TaxID=3981 RepID=A0A6A6L2N1_HEVBR|nr:hypothetical protein GH714_014099 [Hevea brasiliensis]